MKRPCVRGVGGRLKAGRGARAPRPAGRDGLGQCGTTVQYAAPLYSQYAAPLNNMRHHCTICTSHAPRRPSILLHLQSNTVRVCQEASEAPRLGFACSQPLQVSCGESCFCHFYGTICFDSKMREAKTLAILYSCGLNHWLKW